MARRYICGWEVGSLLGEPAAGTVAGSNTFTTTAGSVVVGAVSLETSIVRTGNGSLKVTPASGAAGYWESNSGASAAAPVYFRFYVRITSLPSAARQIWGDNAGGNTYWIRLNTDGSISFMKSVSDVVGTSSTNLTDITKWYRIEIKITAGVQELLLDGVSVATDTAVAPSANRMRFGAEDTVAATYTAYFDDFVRDSAAYPGDGKVVLLLPISDNARSTQWTAGAGGTTNLWDAVNNRPPTGTAAATETNTSQIKHAGGATGSYDANMTAYSTAGIAAGDTINDTMPFVWTGEDSATGDKLLSFNILSNPAAPNTGNFNVADSSSGADGTWPTGWWMTVGVMSGVPSTLNSPVMRVTRPETASRVPSVCFMGIYVDYTPAVTSSPKRMRAAVLGA